MNLPKTKLIDSFQEVPFQEYKLPIITIYYNPLDYPNQYVARVFDLDRPTQYAMVKDSQKEITDLIPYGLNRMERQADDQPHVVEVWF